MTLNLNEGSYVYFAAEESIRYDPKLQLDQRTHFGKVSKTSLGS